MLLVPVLVMVPVLMLMPVLELVPALVLMPVPVPVLVRKPEPVPGPVLGLQVTKPLHELGPVPELVKRWGQDHPQSLV